MRLCVRFFPKMCIRDSHFSDPKKLVRIWTGDIQIHITADIAYAIMQYWRCLLYTSRCV